MTSQRKNSPDSMLNDKGADFIVPTASDIDPFELDSPHNSPPGNGKSRSSSSLNNDDEPFHKSVDKYKEEMRKKRGNNGCNPCCRRLVDKLQSIYLPECMSCCPSTPSFDEDDQYHPPGRVPLIRGLDPVIRGTQPCADSVYLCGIKPFRYLWYMLSGTLCDVIQFCIDLILLHTFHIKDPSMCWALGFGISIIFRHTSHRYLIFGDYVGGYCSSLMRMYAGYSIIIVISTLFNLFMTRVLELPHYVAWVVTLLWTGIVNYFILKKIWSFDGKSHKTKAEPLVSGENNIV